jgi:imidazolonepropionase-like amidohydrolase
VIASRIVRALAAVIATLGFVSAQTPSAEASKRPSIAIVNVAVVDVERGETFQPRTVLIVDGRIAAIGGPETVRVPPGAVRVDGHNRYLMPGLVDMHVHLFNNASRRAPNEWAFPLFVANGVTGIREMRTEPAGMATVERWRSKAARGELVAPRILAAGVAVRGETPDASRRAVQEAKAAHADFVKIFSEVPEPQWRAIIDEARSLHLPVCGHIPSGVSALEAAKAGQRSNEHLTQVYEACSDQETKWIAARKGLEAGGLEKLRETQELEVLENFDLPACDRTAAELTPTRQVQVPTLVLARFEANGVPANFREDPRWPYLRPDEQTRWERIFAEGYPVAGDKLTTKRWDVSRQIVKTLHASGVRILAGTDSPMPQVYPGFSLHKELELLVEAGLSPADALRAATIWPAEFLGLSDGNGSITTGKRADLLLLDGNPLDDIRQTQRIRAVILAGRLFHRPELDRLLESTQRK